MIFLDVYPELLDHVTARQHILITLTTFIFTLSFINKFKYTLAKKTIRVQPFFYTIILSYRRGNLIYHHWRWISIYHSLSYSLGSLDLSVLLASNIFLLLFMDVVILVYVYNDLKSSRLNWDTDTHPELKAMKIYKIRLKTRDLKGYDNG